MISSYVSRYIFETKSYVIYNYIIEMARFLIAFFALFAYANAFCFHASGGIGEYHKDCGDYGDVGKFLRKQSFFSKNYFF